MSNKVKDVNIKNHLYYFFDDMINIKNLDPSNIKIIQKYSYLLHCICDGQRFEIHKN